MEEDSDGEDPQQFWKKHVLSGKYKAPVRHRKDESEEQFLDRVSEKKSAAACRRRGHEYPPCLECKALGVILAKTEWDKIQAELREERKHRKRQALVKSVAKTLADVAKGGVTEKKLLRFIDDIQSGTSYEEALRRQQHEATARGVSLAPPQQKGAWDNRLTYPHRTEGCLSMTDCYRGELEELAGGSISITWDQYLNDPKWKHTNLINVKVGRYWKTFAQRLASG